MAEEKTSGDNIWQRRLDGIKGLVEKCASSYKVLSKTLVNAIGTRDTVITQAKARAAQLVMEELVRSGAVRFYEERDPNGDTHLTADVLVVRDRETWDKV